jgi:hypothetical protein
VSRRHDQERRQQVVSYSHEDALWDAINAYARATDAEPLDIGRGGIDAVLFKFPDGTAYEVLIQEVDPETGEPQ